MAASPKQTKAARAIDVRPLAELSVALGAIDEPRQILRLIVHAAREMTRAQSGSIMTIDEKTGKLRVEAFEGFSDMRIDGLELTVGQGITGWVALHGRPLMINNVNADPRYHKVQDDIQSELVVPMRHGGRLLGVLSVDSPNLNHFNQAHQDLLMSLASHSARVMEIEMMQAKLLQTEEQLRAGERLAVLGELAAGVAHEIRNPLTSLKLLFTTMHQAGAIKPEFDRDVQMMNKQIQRLEKIVEQFLGLAKPEKSSRADMVELNVNDVIHESCRLLGRRYAEKLVALKFESIGADLRGAGNSTMLFQICVNLLMNALEAVGPGCSVRILGCHSRDLHKHSPIPLNPDDLRSSAAQLNPDDHVAVLVEDDGPGLPPTVKERLFQPFVTTKANGVGLGLSIVRRLARLQGGIVHAYSPVRGDRGTLFVVRLPRERPLQSDPDEA
ncbi:MAG TPA: GAF domain-containing protein [Planctomycetota bacterium]|nr:GAF domain-containing protein [Planctomycetota bacterium]